MSYKAKQFLRLLLCILCFWPCWGVVHASDTFLVPASSLEVAKLLEKAAVLEKQGKWEAAIEHYQKILQSYPHRVVEVENNLYQSSEQVVLKRLAALPAEAQKRYQELTRVDARQSFAQLDLEKLTVFPYSILCTEEGLGMLWHIVDWYLARERYQEAVSYLTAYLKNDLVIPEQKEEVLLGCQARLGLCYYALGEKQFLQELEKRIGRKRYNKELLLGENKRTVVEYVGFLTNHMKERLSILDKDVSWPMYGKNVGHTFVSEEPIAELKHRWFIRIPLAVRDMQPNNFYNEMPRSAEGPPPYYPVIAEGTIFINNGKDVFAYDLFSSRLKWHYQGLLPRLKSNECHEQIIHKATYHNGSLYVNVEGDTPTQRAEHWSIYQIRKVIPERRLVKLDAKTGQFQWQVKNEKGDDESFENKVSFMSPPVVWGKYLYSGVTELSGLFNSYVVAIRPDNGEIAWKTLIGSAQQELNMFGRPVREAVGSNVATGNGRLYYLTNLGACAALDILSGRMEWLYRYERIPIYIPDRALFNTIYRDPSWFHSPIILANNFIYFAPLDSQYLYCLDAWTGELRWRRHRGSHRYLLTVAEGKVVLGGQNLEVLNAFTGGSLQEFRNIERVAGMGMVAEASFYCPGYRHLYCLDLKDLTMTRREWPEVALDNGHILQADSVLIRASPSSLYAFFDLEATEDRLKKLTGNPLGYLKLAHLYTQKNSLSQAEEMYQQLLTLSQSSRRMNNQFYQAQAENGLVHIYSRMATREEESGQWQGMHKFYSQALRYAKEADDIIPILLAEYRYYQKVQQYEPMKECLGKLLGTYGQKNVCLPPTGMPVSLAVYASHLLARHYEDTKDPAEAVKIYQNILHQYADRNYEGMNAGKWAGKNIQRLVKTSPQGQKIYRIFDEQAQKLYEDAQQKPGKSNEFLTILERYPNTQYFAEIYVAMTKALIQEGKNRDAIEHLRRFIRERPEDASLLKAYALLIECYENMKMHTTAKAILEHLGRSYAEQTVTIDKETVRLADYVQQKLAQKVYSEVDAPYIPDLRLWESETPKYQFWEYSQNELLRLLEVSGTPAPQYRDLVFLNLGDTLYCRDGATGRLRWRQNLGWTRGVGFIGDRLFAWTRNQVIALDAQTGETSWKNNVPNRFVSLTLGRDVLAALSYDAQKEYATVALCKPDSATIIWSTTFPGKEPGDIILGKDTLLAYAKNPSGLFAHNLVSKVLLQRWNEPEERQSGTWQFYPVVTNPDYLCLVRDTRWVEGYRLPSLKAAWRYDASSLVRSSVDGNEEYLSFVCKNNQLVMLDIQSGDMKWSWQVPANSMPYRLVPDWETLYFLADKEEGRQEKIHLWALDVQNGALRWAAPISQERSRVNISHLLTQRYLVLTVNRWAMGWQSTVMVYDKFSGEKVKQYEVRGGDRGRTTTEVCVRGGHLWLVKDNACWALGE